MSASRFSQKMDALIHFYYRASPLLGIMNQALCYPETGKKLMQEMYKYDVIFLGTWNNFFIFPMIGAGLDGYILVFHKHHFHSMAEIPKKDLRDLKKIIRIIKSEIYKSYGPSIVFEHGSTCDNISCLIDHAHIHIVPVPAGFDMKEEIEREFPLLSLKKFTDIKYWAHGELGQLHYQVNNGSINVETAKKRKSSFSGYLYYEDTFENMFIHELKSLQNFQPQYLRKVLFQKLGREKWEWNNNIDSECQQRTIENLKGLSRYLQPFKYEDDSI